LIVYNTGDKSSIWCRKYFFGRVIYNEQYCRFEFDWSNQLPLTFSGYGPVCSSVLNGNVVIFSFYSGIASYQRFIITH
jgi:hypothetical protein